MQRIGYNQEGIDRLLVELFLQAHSELPDQIVPSQGARLSASRVKKLLNRRRIRRLKAAEVIEKLRSKELPVAPGLAEAAAEHLALLLPQARLLKAQRQQLERKMKILLDDLSQLAGPAEPTQPGSPPAAERPGGEQTEEPSASQKCY